MPSSPIEPERWAATGIALSSSPRDCRIRPPTPAQTERATEWLMLTSGTSGVPKIVGHTLEGLTGAIVADRPGAQRPAAGLGDLLRHPPLWRPADIPARHHRRRLDGAVRALARRSPITSARLQARGVTHISGTPSHWRKLLMSGAA